MIKAYIFDQDGTLYPKNSELTDALRERTKEWISESLGITREEVNAIYAQLPKEFPHAYHGFLSLGLSPEEYHREVFDKVDPALFLIEDKRLVTLFSRIPVPKFVVTLASLGYSERLQQRLGVYDSIEKTISAIEHPPTYSKAEAYELIRGNLGITAEEICVIGDNLSTDILPAVENGFKGILVDSSNVSNRGFQVIGSIYSLEEFLENRTPH
ncbi:MAG: HAD family hydrolase [Candidatus Heimdallarchaeaceae archaeon]